MFPRMLASTGPSEAPVPLVQGLKNKHDQVRKMIKVNIDFLFDISTQSTTSSSDSTCGGHVGVAWVGRIVSLKGVDRGGGGELWDRIWMARATRIIAPSPGVPRLCFYLTRVQPANQDCDDC